MLFPGTMVFVTVVAINLVGDHLRAAFDPRLRGR
jgi:ABC-type dipeptide/oligopeptide/nickel transport system permease subunit